VSDTTPDATANVGTLGRFNVLCGVEVVVGILIGLENSERVISAQAGIQAVITGHPLARCGESY